MSCETLKCTKIVKSIELRLLNVFESLPFVKVLEGYKCIAKCGERKADRGSYLGGLAVFYRSDLQRYISEIKDQMNGIIWAIYSYESVELILGVVYLQPEISKYANGDFFPCWKSNFVISERTTHEQKLLYWGIETQE